jgi:hypothetical protein
MFHDVRLAIAREKQIKRWRREKKLWLIEERNPTWEDLAERYFGKDARTTDGERGEKQIPPLRARRA